MDLQELQKLAGIEPITEDRDLLLFNKAAADLLRKLELNPQLLNPQQAGELMGMAQQIMAAAERAQGM